MRRRKHWGPSAFRERHDEHPYCYWRWEESSVRGATYTGSASLTGASAAAPGGFSPARVEEYISIGVFSAHLSIIHTGHIKYLGPGVFVRRDDGTVSPCGYPANEEISEIVPRPDFVRHFVTVIFLSAAVLHPRKVELIVLRKIDMVVGYWNALGSAHCGVRTASANRQVFKWASMVQYLAGITRTRGGGK